MHNSERFQNVISIIICNIRIPRSSHKQVYHSDNEDSFDEKFSPKSKQSPSSHCTEEESHFLSVVARGICLNAIGGREEVLNLLRKELEGMGVLQADGDGVGGALSRHLLSIQFDIGQKPKAKYVLCYLLI